MKLSEKVQEALREQQEINLSDPAVQKRLAAQWGYAPAEAQPATSVPREAIDKMLTQLMDIAVSNGANSISMPDEYVEVAAWLCGIPAQPAPSIPEFCPCCGNIMRACMCCPNEDCNAVTVTAEQAKYNKQHAVARKASGAAEPKPEAKS